MILISSFQACSCRLMNSWVLLLGHESRQGQSTITENLSFSFLTACWLLGLCSVFRVVTWPEHPPLAEDLFCGSRCLILPSPWLVYGLEQCPCLKGRRVGWGAILRAFLYLTTLHFQGSLDRLLPVWYAAAYEVSSFLRPRQAAR